MFLSSVKFNGESTAASPFTEGGPPQPHHTHGISKREPEDVLKRIAAESGMDIITLRPPLALVNNRRNLICVSNLEDATVCCMYAPASAGKTYLNTATV